MPVLTLAGQRVGTSIWSSKPLPLKCQRGDQTGAIVSRSIRKAGTIGDASQTQNISAARKLASRGSGALARGVQIRRSFR
jgi:hypothetical protein